VRGSGLFLAVELTDQPQPPNSVPGPDQVVAGVAREMGVFVRPLGGTILIAPPLTFTRDQAERVVEVLDTALTRVEHGSGTPGGSR